MNSLFEKFFAGYLTQAKQARDQNQHHDFRRQIFLAFLHDVFGIESSDMDVEQYIQIANKQVSAKGIARIRKGWIDAVFHDLIFEFKRDLKREEAEGLRELYDYLSTIPHGAECIGLLTDGLIFTAYVLDESEPHHLRRIDSINLEGATSHLAYLWLDAYLLRQSNVSPTSADIVRRFGLLSPTFVAAAQPLREALKIFGSSEAGALEVKRQQWAFHLARVYGNADNSNDEMFVRHTYLCQFAKVLAHASYFGVSETAKHIEDVINGKAFHVLGVSNIGEQDFFAWVLSPQIRPQIVDIFRRVAESFVVYDLRKIDEDLLKQLYQNLVEPETRHELGEFYTPDWLAELTLREIAYQPGQSLLDPACGSGTFLFTALRRLSDQGMVGQKLVDFALDNIVGMDIHPLAVTIAKINYMLAILPHLQSGSRRKLRTIPISMANALQVPSKTHRIEVIEVPIEHDISFKIPAEAASKPAELVEVLEEMGRYAKEMAPMLDRAKFGGFSDFALNKLSTVSNSWDVTIERATWSANVHLLAKQINEGRDSIWGYVLQNTSRPLVLSYKKFDVIAGNPPWISYRYIQDRVYQGEIKKLTREYELLASNEMKLNTQMELATLFFEHCRHMYLKPNGTIAFVMPRSVITGAKQHHAFQQRGFSQVLDLKGVTPLFGVETCVMIRKHGDVYTADIPTIHFEGTLPAHECTWVEASPLLIRTQTITDFVKQEKIASPYYHPLFKQGATLVPRNLAFVTSAQPNLAPGQLAFTPIMQTDPDVNRDAKVPWKEMTHKGYIDEDFLYATLLSKQLLPFGIGRLHLVALPVRVGIPKQLTALSGQVLPERFIPMSLEEMRESNNYARSADEWFGAVEQLWQQNKKETTKETLAQWFNYQNKLTAQSAAPGYFVVYGAAGSNLAASVIDTHNLPIINGAQPRAFVVDHTAYWYRTTLKDEAYYLSALLNAPCIDAAIKSGQTRGLFGERHIHRRPFEVCAIPQFNPNDPLHQQLAVLSQAAHAAIAPLEPSKGGVVAARKKARQSTHTYIEQIDKIVQRMLGLKPTSNTLQDAQYEEEW
jgi:methylase of polypeptide subunit release factors